MPTVTLAWRFQPGTDYGSSSRAYAATKVSDVTTTKKGTRYDDVLPDDEIFAKYEFVVDRVVDHDGGKAVVSEVVFLGGIADEQSTEHAVENALEAAGWAWSLDKFNETED